MSSRIKRACSVAKNSVKANGIAPPSVSSLSLQKLDEGSTDDAYNEEVIKGATGTIYVGATIFHLYTVMILTRLQGGSDAVSLC